MLFQEIICTISSPIMADAIPKSPKDADLRTQNVNDVNGTNPCD